MSKTFFSVDVETTSTDPFNGQLLTIGIQAVNEETLELDEDFYIRLAYDPDGPIDVETDEWWGDQSDQVYDEAWRWDRERFAPENAALAIQSWVNDFGEEWKDRVFCANPATFDYPWIQKLFSDTGIDNPFHYRVMCLRSVAFGLYQGNWGESREATGEFHKSEIPHHALHDAIAQAKDLQKMLKDIRNES